MNRYALVLMFAVLCSACDRGASDDDDRPAAAAAVATTGGGLARISERAAIDAGIALGHAGPATIHDVLPLYGVIKADPEHEREVRARYPGIIRSATKAVGDSVRAGETLATIESNDSLQTYPLAAPISGVISARGANPGEQSGDTVLYRITDAGSVLAELNLFPGDAARVRAGQRVRVDASAGGLRGEGRVSLVGAYGDGGALVARLRLDNRERRWTPGLFVTGNVELASNPVAVAIASDAVQQLDGRSVVFVPVDGGYRARPIKTGRSDGDWQEVLDGLDDGEVYVAHGSFVVKAELGKSLLEEDEASDEGPATEPKR